MGLNRVNNPAKVRKVEAMLGRPVARVVARYFKNQNDLLALAPDQTGGYDAFVVNFRAGTVEPYPDETFEVMEHGIRGVKSPTPGVE